MSFITHRKVKDVVYAYEVTSYRDENGKKKAHYKYLGRVAEDGQTIITGKKKKSKEDETKSASAIVSYRTQALAEENTSSLDPCPEMLAVPTSPDYQHCISLHHEGKAYLEKLISTEGLEFKDSKMFFKGKLEPISTVELQDMRTREGIEEIDIPLLTMYYTIILASFME